MAEVSQKEAVANAVINPEAVVPNISGIRTDAEKRGFEIREKLKTQGARETMTDLLNVDTDAILDKTIDTNIAGKPDTDGKIIRTPEAQQRFKDANEAADKVYEFLDKGLAMNPAKLTEITDDLRNVIKLVPEMDDLLNGLSGTQVEALLQEKLQDPKFREILQEKMKGISGTKIEDDSQAEANRKAHKEAERARKAKEDEVNGLSGQLKHVTDRLDEYKISGNKPHDRLEEIETKLPDLKKDAENAETALRGIDRRAMTYESQRVMLLDQLNKSYSSSSTDIADKLKTVDEELAKLDKERAEQQKIVTEHQSQVKEHKELKEKEAAYQKEQQELQKKQADANRELSDLTSDANELKGKVALSDRERADLEEKFVRSINAVFIKTSVDFLKGESAAAEAVNQQIMEENIAKAKDTLEKGVFNNLKDGGRWDRTRTVGGLLGNPRTTVEINKDAVDMDYATLLLDGPDALVRGILAEQNPLLTEDQLDEKMNDKDFVDKASETAAKQLLMKRIKSGGKISDPEAYKIATSEWGGKALDAAIQGNAAAKKMTDELRIDGALKGTTPAEWARNNPSAVRLLLSILVGGASLAAGIAVAPIAGAGVLAGGASGGAARWYRSWSS